MQIGGKDMLQERIERFNRRQEFSDVARQLDIKLTAKNTEEAEWESYSAEKIQDLFDLTEDEALKLLKSGLLKVYRAGNEYRTSKKSVADNERAISALVHYKNNKTITVMDVSRILGLGKTATYRLINKNLFKKFLVFGKIRVDVESFEEWYSGQFHYKKISGELPGTKYGETLSPLEIARLLNIPRSTARDLLTDGKVDYVLVNGNRRVPRESFEKWYASQTKYTKQSKQKAEVLDDDI